MGGKYNVWGTKSDLVVWHLQVKVKFILFLGKVKNSAHVVNFE